MGWRKPGWAPLLGVNWDFVRGAEVSMGWNLRGSDEKDLRGHRPLPEMGGML